MGKYQLYILESEKDQKLFIGISADVVKRVLQHDQGKVVSTRARRPLKLIYRETYGNRQEALQRERYLKKLKSSKYLRAHITGPDSSVG